MYDGKYTGAVADVLDLYMGGCASAWVADVPNPHMVQGRPSVSLIWMGPTNNDTNP